MLFQATTFPCALVLSSRQALDLSLLCPHLAQGLAALLVQGLQGCTPEQIVRIPPDWMATMGLQQSLTPSRNNGFLNMFRLMQQKAMALLVMQVIYIAYAAHLCEC